jgi:hypothetical protein
VPEFTFAHPAAIPLDAEQLDFSRLPNVSADTHRAAALERTNFLSFTSYRPQLCTEDRFALGSRILATAKP